MPGFTKEEYIQYRIGKAWSTFTDARTLADAQSWNSSVNRLYYACFYAVLALFSKHDISSHSHSGVKTMLSLKFIKPGLLEKDLGILYSDLFDFRQKGDYGDFFDFDENTVRPLFPLVEGFVKEIEELLKK